MTHSASQSAAKMKVSVIRSASQECETETAVLGRGQLYTSLLVSTDSEANREASEGASISCCAHFC